jgi:hypothetical protein
MVVGRRQYVVAGIRSIDNIQSYQLLPVNCCPVTLSNAAAPARDEAFRAASPGIEAVPGRDGENATLDC